MIDPGRLKRLLAILKYEAQRKGYSSGATPEQRRAYYDDLLRGEERRKPWTSKAPQHGFRGPAEDREGSPREVPPRLSRALALAGEDIADVAGQYGGNLAQIAVQFPEGGLRLAGQEDLADKLEEVRESIAKSVGPAKTKAGVVSGMAGVVSPFVAGSMGGGSLVNMLLRGAAMDVPAEASGRDFSVLGMIADWRKKKAEKEGRELTPTEESLERGAESPWARGLSGGTFGATAGLLGELLPGARAARKAEDARLLERATPPFPPILKDADQEAIDKVVKARYLAERDHINLPKYEGPERRATRRPESRMPEEMDIPRMGAAHPALVKAVARTGIGAAGGAVATSEEGGLTPLQGALIGGAALGAGPEAMRLLKGKKPPAKGAKVPQHPVLISELTPHVKNDYDVTISSLADSPEGIPEVVARAERLKPGFPEKITRGKTERIALAEATPLEGVLAKTGPLDDVDVEALKLNYNRNREELKNLYVRQATEIDAVEAEKIGARIDELEGVNDQIINRRVPSASDMGRAFAALRGDFDATSPLAWIQKSKKILGRDLTEAEKEEVQRLIKAGDHEEAAGYIRSLSEPLTMKNLAFWTLLRKGGSLLAAPVSVLRPLVGNPTNAAFNAASRPATVLIDVMASILRSGSPVAKRSTSIRGTGRQLWEGAKGAVQGIPEGGRILLSGLDPAAAEKLEVQRGQRLKSPLGFDVPEGVRAKFPKGFRPRRIDAVDAWTQFWLRIQGAVDRPFRTATVKASNVEQASLIARREGLKGKERKARVAFLIANPTPEMGILSNLRADHISFQNETWISSVVSAGKRRMGGSEKVGTRKTGLSPAILAGAELIQPFSRTPSSIIIQGMEATPFGLVGAASDAVRVARAVSKGDEKLATELQRRMASRGGRVITGLVPIWLGAKWHREGKMLATPPEAGSERTQFYATGKAPFTIHMGDQWVSVAQLGPVGAGFSFGAMLDRLAQKEEQTVGEMLGSAMGGLDQFLNTATDVGAATIESTARLALETPFMKGTKDVVEALGDVQAKAGEKVAQMGASFIPNILAIQARKQDPVVRRPEGILETMKTRIPGQSQDIKPSLMAATGEPTLREAPGHEQKWWHRVLGSSPDRTKFDATIAEMESVGAAVGKIEKWTGESDDAYFKRQQFTGDMVQLAVGAMANPTSPESQSVLRDFGLDGTVTIQGTQLSIPEIYRIAKTRPRNDPDLALILQALGEAPGFPADMQNAGDILEYAISRARGFATTQVRKAGR